MILVTFTIKAAFPDTEVPCGEAPLDLAATLADACVEHLLDDYGAEVAYSVEHAVESVAYPDLDFTTQVSEDADIDAWQARAREALGYVEGGQ